MLKCVKRAPSNLWNYHIRDKKPKQESVGGCISRYGTCTMEHCAGVNVDVKLSTQNNVYTCREKCLNGSSLKSNNIINILGA